MIEDECEDDEYYEDDEESDVADYYIDCDCKKCLKSRLKSREEKEKKEDDD